MAKVLVVDDESGMRDVIQVALMRLGHEVVLAPNGERAYALACEYKPNLIVTDVNMPNWNGLELLRAVNNNPNHRELAQGSATGPALPPSCAHARRGRFERHGARFVVPRRRRSA